MRSWHKAAFLITVLVLVVYLAVKQSSISEKTISYPSPTTVAVLVTPTVITQVTNIPGTCHINGVLPDSSCTPGAIDPRVTQDDINRTICVTGYTKTVRPPVSYTNKLKIEQIAAYGYSDTNLKDYEEDHLIPLELGGAPSDPNNLWPEPGNSPNPKDKIENICHQEICNGQITLAEAQHEIATNWQTACQ